MVGLTGSREFDMRQVSTREIHDDLNQEIGSLLANVCELISWNPTAQEAKSCEMYASSPLKSWLISSCHVFAFSLLRFPEAKVILKSLSHCSFKDYGGTNANWYGGCKFILTTQLRKPKDDS